MSTGTLTTSEAPAFGLIVEDGFSAGDRTFGATIDLLVESRVCETTYRWRRRGNVKVMRTGSVKVMGNADGEASVRGTGTGG